MDISAVLQKIRFVFYSTLLILALCGLGRFSYVQAQTTLPEESVWVQSALQKLSPDLQTLWRETQATQEESLLTQTGEDVRVQVFLPASANPDWVTAHMTDSIVSRAFAGVRWVVGDLPPQNLLSIAVLPEVSQIRTSIANEPTNLAPLMGPFPMPANRPAELSAALDIHHVRAAHSNGYVGQGVTLALLDSGVDFGHPELQGQQARVPSGAYADWPFSYNTQAVTYAFNANYTITPATYNTYLENTWYVGTLPIASPDCTTTPGSCTATLDLLTSPSVVSYAFTWPNTSLSGNYYYSVHPDRGFRTRAQNLGLGYAGSAPAVVIVTDPNTAGVYDTVYVDVNFDQTLALPQEDMHKYDGMDPLSELAGADVRTANNGVGTDGLWDISAGMLTWISDGVNPPPGIGVLYNGVTVPAAGRLVIFTGDDRRYNHGTRTASSMAGLGVITDPFGLGSSNAHIAGGANVGGVGGAVVPGVAPQAKVASFQMGWLYAQDSWTLAGLGFDGVPDSGDEAQVVNNSWANFSTVDDGWDDLSRFVHNLNRTDATHTLYTASTGNDGHGYGTICAPGGGSFVDVGASTEYGNLRDTFEFGSAEQLNWGNVQPWSNHGPGMAGDVGGDVMASGAWPLAANPLNGGGNAQTAYVRFAGTSQATAIASGVLGIIYQAYADAHGGVFPTWQEATDFLVNGADDLGADIFSQGAGNVNAERSAELAAGAGVWVEMGSGQWQSGETNSNTRLFPAVQAPDSTSTRTFTIHNDTATSQLVNLSDGQWQAVHTSETTYTFGALSNYADTLPHYVVDLTNEIATYNASYVRAELVYPFASFDQNGDSQWTGSDGHWRVLFYDWKDHNGDGNLWVDTDSDGIVDSGEIDTVPDSLSSYGVRHEYLRLTYGRTFGTLTRADLTGESIQRAHDGIFLGLQCRSGCGLAGGWNIKVRLTYYQRVDWDWLTLSTTSLNIPANSSATFSASMNIPANTKSGLYPGGILYETGGRTQLLPTVAQVADTWNGGFLNFGGNDNSSPYPNGVLLGGFEWHPSINFEAGDWRVFYYTVPPDMGENEALNASLDWSGTHTDIDMYLYGADAQDSWSTLAPNYFGPSGMTLLDNSDINNVGGTGRFLWETRTGTTSEWVAGRPAEGLGMLILHMVGYEGDVVGESFNGRIDTLSLTSETHTASPQTNGSFVVDFLSTGDMMEAMTANVYGLSAPIVASNQAISPYLAVCDDWYSAVSIPANGGLLQARITATTANNLDVFVYRDGGNGVFNCGSVDDILLGSATTASALDSAETLLPSAGNYWVAVRGMDVQGGDTFNIEIRKPAGTNLVLSGIPASLPSAGVAVPLTVSYDINSIPYGGTVDGILFAGPTSKPTLLRTYIRLTHDYPWHYWLPIIFR